MVSFRTVLSPKDYINGSIQFAQTIYRLRTWTVPATIGMGWLVWPGLTDQFKEEVLGIKKKESIINITSKSSNNQSKVFHKYVYERAHVAAVPTLVEN